MTKAFRAVLFTDLDGTFLDHDNYHAGEVSDVLSWLETRHIPLVFCSSKTFAEQRFIQQRYGILAPFIFENGSGIAIPHGYFEPGTYEVWKRTDGFDVVRLARKLGPSLHAFLRQFAGFTGFKNAPDDALARATGLSGTALDRARDRWFTETLLQPLHKVDIDPFLGHFFKKGWTFSQGGRFITIQSADTDKGRALIPKSPFFNLLRVIGVPDGRSGRQPKRSVNAESGRLGFPRSTAGWELGRNGSSCQCG